MIFGVSLCTPALLLLLLQSWFTKYHVKMLSVKIQYQKFLVVVKSKSPRSCLRSLELGQSYL